MNLCSCRPSRTGNPSARIHSASSRGFKPGQPVRVFEDRREQHLMHALRELMALREIAGKIVIAAAGNHKLDFVLLVDCVEIGRIEGVRFAGIRAFYIDNLDDFARQRADEALAARFDHHRVARREKLLRELRRFRLQQRLAAGDFDERCLAVAVARERAHAVENFVDGVFRAAMEGVGGIAPGAAKIAAGEAHEDAGQSRARAFSLDGFENFGDDHRKTSCSRNTENQRPHPHKPRMGHPKNRRRRPGPKARASTSISLRKISPASR